MGQMLRPGLSFSTTRPDQEVSKITWHEINFGPVNLITIGALWKNAKI